MQFTLSQAAKATGSSKSTISKALANGRLSGERQADGSFRIEAAELFRVFPAKTAETGLPNGPVAVREQQGERLERAEAGDDLLRLELRMVRDQFAQERAERERERREHERERETILERERTTAEDLRRRLDRAEERVLALTALPAQPAPQTAQEQPVEVPAVVETAKPSKGFLARLLGR